MVAHSTVKKKAETDPLSQSQRVGDVDALTFCIVLAEGEGSERRVVMDVIKGWARCGGESVALQGVVREIARTLKLYGLYVVRGDQYSAQWVRQAFEAEDIDYEDAPEKSVAYREVEPLFAQGRIVLLGHPQMVRKLKMLERRNRSRGQGRGGPSVRTARRFREQPGYCRSRRHARGIRQLARLRGLVAGPGCPPPVRASGY
jgi:hypothetical protein